MNVALDPRRSVSVAASAGSGKTWQLVSRIVRLLLDGAAPGGIVALTFTRKAAAEMRERVERRLRELAYADDATLDAQLRELDLEPDATLRARARAQYEPLLFAPFGLRAQTLHAFCQDVLTRFAIEADVPAGFELIEDEAALLDEAFAALLERIRRAPESAEASAFTALIADGASESNLRTWLLGFAARRSDWWAYTETMEGDVAAEASAALAAELAIEPDADPDAAFAAPEFGQRLMQLHDLLREVKGLGHFKAELLTEALAERDAAARGAAAMALLTKDGSRRSFKQKKDVSDAAYGQITELYDALCQTLQAVRETQLRLATWRRSSAAYRLGAVLLDELASALRARRALTFADLEWRTYRLLRDDSQGDWVRYKLDQRLDHLLLDEFQDTNPTQWSLLLPLLAEMAAGDPERPRSAFIVGDAKQSIYGFRRANPELLQTAANYLEQAFAGSPMPLNDSRRSAPAVIDFVNAVFAGADGAAIGYAEHGTWRREDWGAIEVAPLVQVKTEAAASNEAATTLRNPLTTPRSSVEDLRARTEAEQVAARIGALVAARLPIIDGGNVRALRYDDVMILARHRTHLAHFERALAAQHIPFAAASRGTLLETPLARDLIALLRFLDAPHRNLDLAQVLRSPLFAADDAALLALARGAERGAWWPVLQALDSDTDAPLVRATALLSRWLGAAKTLPAHDLVAQIGHESGLLARYASAQPEDRRLRANYGAFLQLLLDTDRGRYPTLGRINRHLARLRAGSGAPDEAAPPADGAVRIMTIHASKGLEAPAVFVVNSAPASRSGDDGWLIEWPSGADAPSHFVLAGRADQRDALSRDLHERQKAREAREALNLLYVALTRARQFLFVSAFESGRRSAEVSWHQRCVDAITRLANTEAADAALPGAVEGALSHRRGTQPTLASTQAPPPAPITIDARLQRPLPFAQRFNAPSGADATQDPDRATRGRAIHWLLQQLSEGRLGTPATLAARLNAALATTIDSAALPAWLAEAEQVHASPALAAFFDASRYQRAWNEAPVQWLEGGALQSGVIDRLIDDGSTLWILDYKTALRPDATALRQRHRGQLEAYRQAVSRLWPGRPLRAGLVLTATATWLELE